MKIAILGDTHFTFKKGDKNFNNYFEKFYVNVFFPYLKENNIDVILQTGDFFDDRKHTHLQGFSECKRYFFDYLKDNNIKLYTILGNHDIAHKNSLEINSPSLLLKGYDNIVIIDKPTVLGEYDILCIPWICSSNENHCTDAIEKSNNPICFGHFEFANFSMYKGIENKEGMDTKPFEKFEMVISGHYHHKSYKDNVYYTGTPYQLTMHDADDPRGFHILDLSSRTLEFIENPYKMFNIIEYSDKICFSELNQYENSYLKVYVKERTDEFEIFLDHLNQVNPIKINVIEEVADLSSDEEMDVKVESTQSIITKYIDGINNKDVDLNRLKLEMLSLYEQASRLNSESYI